LTDVAPVSTNQKGALNKNISPPSNQKLPETKIAGIIPLWQLLEKTPFFIFSVVFSIMAYYAQYKPSLKLFPLGARIANAPVSFMTYLEKTFWPHDLAVFYPFSNQIPVWQVLGAALLILVISAAVITVVKRLPYLFVGWLWYAITILPVIGIIQIGNVAMADRFTYLPFIGIAIMLAWGIPLLFSCEDVRKKILFPAGIAALAILAVLTWKQCGYWKNSITLSNHALQVTKDNYMAYNNRGSAYDELGQYQRAIEDLNKSILLKPNYNLAYCNRGTAYAGLGQYQRAVEDFNKAIHLKPDFADAYHSRGTIYYNLGQKQLAIEDFNKAIRLKSDYIDAYYNRGTIYGALGQYQRAIEDFNKAIRLKPDYIDAYYNRGTAYAMLGQHPLAIEDYNKTIRLKPDYAAAYNNRGFLYLSQGNNKLGCLDAQKACELGNCKTLEAAKGSGYCR
jgi:tetratricopeptide (TPR) repeat protein